MCFDGGVDLGQDGGDVEEPKDLQARLRRRVVVVDLSGTVAPPAAGLVWDRRRDLSNVFEDVPREAVWPHSEHLQHLWRT